MRLMDQARITSIAKLGTLIRARRRARRLTQQELAKRADIGRQWLNELEGGKESGVPLPLLLRTLSAVGLALIIQDDINDDVSLTRSAKREAQTELSELQNRDLAEEKRSSVTVVSAVDQPKHNKQAQREPGTYKGANLEAEGLVAEPTRFYDLSYRNRLREMVSHVISVEGPIFDDLLARRIARAHNISRATSKIKKIIRKLIDPKFQRTKERARTIIWPDNADPKKWTQFRPASLDVRDHSDIPLVELAALAKSYSTATIKDAASSMRQPLGLTRMLPKTRRRFEAAACLNLENSSL